MRTLRFIFKSICSSSLNWRAGGMCLNAPSREAYRSWKTSWLCTTASHSGQTPFPSHWTQRINQDIWWHGSTQCWHCFRPFQQKNGFENPWPRCYPVYRTPPPPPPPPLKRPKKTRFLLAELPSLHMLPWCLRIFIQVSQSLFPLHFHRLHLKTI